MTAEEIRDAVNASPELLALAEAPEADVSLIATILSAGRTKMASLLISERGILERYAAGPLAADTVLTKLEAFSATAHPMASIVKRAMKFLAQPEGLDVGSPATQSLIDALAAGGVITADEATNLKNIAAVPDAINGFQVQQAIFAEDGTLLVGLN